MTYKGILVACGSEMTTGTLKELIETNLYMPFPFSINPHEREAATGVDSWLRTWGLNDDPTARRR